MLKRAIVDQIEVTADANIQVRLRKQILDGESVIELGYHRTVVECGTSCDAQFDAVNRGLEKLGFPPVIGWDRVRNIANTVFTKEAVDAWQAKQIAIANARSGTG